MSSDSSARLKNAASLLIKGGTLTGEPCEDCGGVLIRFDGKLTCINCGREQDVLLTSAKSEPSDDTAKPRVPDLDVCEKAVEKKISQLAAELEPERDVLIQKQKAELLESYLRILEKIRNMNK